MPHTYIQTMPGNGKTILRRARLVVTPFTPSEMQQVGEVARLSILARLSQGLDVYDMPAPPLSPRYAKAKASKNRGFRQTIRDWFYTGHTWRSLQVIRATNNQVRIGFVSEKARFRVEMNQRVRWQWGLSDRNYYDVLGTVARFLPGATNIRLGRVTSPARMLSA